MTDTIFALSSGAPPAAIAVVRISGPGRRCRAGGAGRARCREPRGRRLRRLARRTAKSLDNALVLRFPGPNSATGEDVAELHLHGGRAVVAAVLGGARRRSQGLRPAEPGEFTRRAFENGRIDLAEAEGLADLLEAETEAQRRAALALAGGALSRQVEAWRERLLALVGRRSRRRSISPTRTTSRRCRRDFARGSRRLPDEIGALRSRGRASERLRDGVRVVIAGPPNAGKSSLLNALVGREAAIIIGHSGHDARSGRGAGRDRRRAVPADRHGRAARGRAIAVEAIGVERAQASVAAAPTSCSGSATPARRPSGALPGPRQGRSRPRADGRADVAVSAVTGEGLDELTRLLIRRVQRRCCPPTGEVALNARHRDGARAMAADGVGRGRGERDPLDRGRRLAPGAGCARPGHRASRGRGHARRPVRALLHRQSDVSRGTACG